MAADKADKADVVGVQAAEAPAVDLNKASGRIKPTNRSRKSVKVSIC